MNKVKVYRGVKKISQLELARSVGVSRQTINMIENDKYNPSLKLCINIYVLHVLVYDISIRSDQSLSRVRLFATP